MTTSELFLSCVAVVCVSLCVFFIQSVVFALPVAFQHVPSGEWSECVPFFSWCGLCVSRVHRRRRVSHSLLRTRVFLRV